ncbi:MAG: DapH/DapD/GlmU-related protein, partial [Pseudomonadota bacterium]
IADPARFDLRGTLEFGQDVAVDINVCFEGDVKLGNRVIIGPNVVIRNSSIGDDSIIEAFSHIDETQLADHCSIGPYARLRPGTTADSGAKIGNFVETKKTHIGVNSKINHLSYVGDAHLGKDVNIGAGTITCNYDGVNKNITQIKDGAFIGSNSSLIAPVTIGENATIGAGSTITKEAAAECLTLTRAPQKTLSHWRRPSKRDKKS